MTDLVNTINSINDININSIEIHADIFIKNDSMNIFFCNICSEEINKDNMVRLKCDPDKHYFCYSCILDWFKEVKKLRYTNHYIANMCPICRKNGGFLPVNDGIVPIKGIHVIKTVNKNTKASVENVAKCGVKLKTKDGFCQCVGKEAYGGLCGIHYKNK